MEEFLNKLYGYEYFTTYLIIALVILVVLFFVILFFGKKDQKQREIEATKKLQQIHEEDAFKEEIEAPTQIDVEIPNEEQKLENDTIVVPTIDENELINNEMKIESNQEIEISEPEVPSFDQMSFETINSEEEKLVDSNNVEEVTKTEDLSAPILDKIEERPLIIADNDDKVTINEEIPTKEEVSVPDFNFDDVLRNVKNVKAEESHKVPEVFSSVYAPVNEQLKKDDNNDDLKIELPTLKSEVKEQKKEIEVPVLNDYNLDSLSGESYTINK